MYMAWRVSLKVCQTNLKSSFCFFVVGLIRDIGLPNVKGGAGLIVELKMKPLEGIMTDLSGYWGRFLVPEE